jgi:plastocyanin
MKRYLTKINTHLKQTSVGRKYLYSLIAILILSAAIGLTTQNKGEQPARVAEVQITSNGFEPATLIVKKGTKVVWTNKNTAMHQVASNPHPINDDLPGLNSEILNNNQSYEYTFEDEGDFGYHDNLNPTTNGTIEVQ